MSDEATKAAVEEMLGETSQTFLPVVLFDGTDADQHQTSAAKPPRPQHDITLYEREKRQGVRRANGARKLKKLSARHLKIISLHLAGKSGEQIASLIGCTVVTVSRILNDPLARDLLTKVYEDRQAEIDALAGDAIQAVREGLQGDHPLREKLMAVDKFTKLKDSIGKGEDEGLTAEDVIERMFNRMNVAGDVNVQINAGDK